MHGNYSDATRQSTRAHGKSVWLCTGMHGRARSCTVMLARATAKVLCPQFAGDVRSPTLATALSLNGLLSGRLLFGCSGAEDGSVKSLVVISGDDDAWVIDAHGNRLLS